MSLPEFPFRQALRLSLASCVALGLCGCELFTSAPTDGGPAADDGEEPAVDYAEIEGPAVEVLRTYLGENNFDSRVVFNEEGSVTRVDMTDIEFPNSELHVFADLQNLERVTIWGAGVNDEGMDEVAKLTQITHLTLFNTEITADGLAKLKPLAGNLKMLNLRRSTYLTDESLEHLASFEGLVQLDLLYNNFSDEALTHVSPLENLRVLDLRGCVLITDQGIEKLAGMSQLQALKIRTYGVTDAGMPVIGEFDNLKVLYLQDVIITDEGLKSLSGLNKMEDLTLFGLYGISDEGLNCLASMNALKSLSLRDARINGSCLQHLSDAKELRHLNISETDVDNAGLAHLKDHNKLEHLDLWLTKIDDEGLASLKGLSNLKFLSLAKTETTNEGLTAIAGLTNLTELNLQQTKIDDAGLMKLGGLENLTTLNVSGIPELTDEGIAALKAKLPKLKDVTQ